MELTQRVAEPRDLADAPLDDRLAVEIGRLDRPRATSVVNHGVISCVFNRRQPASMDLSHNPDRRTISAAAQGNPLRATA